MKWIVIGKTRLGGRSGYVSADALEITSCGTAIFSNERDGEWMVVRAISSTEYGQILTEDEWNKRVKPESLEVSAGDCVADPDAVSAAREALKDRSGPTVLALVRETRKSREA